jgi:hypothetical protein
MTRVIQGLRSKKTQFGDCQVGLTKRKLVLVLLGLASLLTCLLIPLRPVPAQTSLTAWVELGPKGVALARVITTTTCPMLQLDGRQLPMQVHAEPTPAFPVRVCEQVIPDNTQSASIITQAANRDAHFVDGKQTEQPLPLPKPNPERVLIIGDTGCRIKGKTIQACNDPQSWPFAQIARQAAAEQPDLVIHVGDYYYREAPCPPGNTGCVGSPWGDNWQAWQAELFNPAQPLLQVAPWVFVRGNHELCSRGGNGWFHFLEPRSQPATCQDYTDAYDIPLGNLQLLMLDSAAADDRVALPEQVSTYTAQLRALSSTFAAHRWLVTHRPFWAFGQDNGERFATNATLQATAAQYFPTNVELVQSGHVHLFEWLNFAADRSAPNRPDQWVVGNSGTALDPTIAAPLVGQAIAGVKVEQAQTLSEFGYVTFQTTAKGWAAAVHRADGQVLTTCSVEQQASNCQPPSAK